MALLLLFSHSVMCDPLWPHELQHARLSHPSLSPRVCSNSCPLSWWCHPTFFMVQLSHPHMTTWKTTALTVWTFVGKVTSLLFSTLSRLVIAFLPRSNHLLVSWLKSLSTVFWEPNKVKSVTLSIFSPSICYEVMGPDAMILVFLMLSFKPAFSLSVVSVGGLNNRHLFSYSSED